MHGYWGYEKGKKEKESEGKIMTENFPKLMSDINQS
jgi:hypothetical protein